MRLDRIFALVLIVLCLVATLGNWLGNSNPSSKTEDEGFGINGQANVALLEIYGTISDEPTNASFGVTNTSSSNYLIDAIRQIREDRIKAILLHINSPGGTAAASQAVYQELMRTRQETDIKIVASMGDVAASGGYYVACAADRIVANPGTITGSIGVIVSTANVSSLLNNIGVQIGNVKSGQYKDILSPYDDLSEGERNIVEQIVAQSYQQFLDAIVASRKIPLEQLKPLADGRIFTGEQAKQENLVDSLGNSYDALQMLAELANITGEPKVRNYTNPSWQDSLGIFLSSSWQHLLPNIKQAYLNRWNSNRLNLMME